MTRKEHLLLIMSEECSEVSHRISKALRFGLDEIQPGQEFTNAERIMRELGDLIAIYEMLRYDEKVLDKFNFEMVSLKREKVEKFLKLSQKLGTLE